MSDIAQDLGGVVRLLEKATPGPWTVGRFGSVHRPKVEGSESSVGSPIVVGGSKSGMYDGYQENCEAIAAAVNFLRAHSAEIAGALRDAERLDYIERTFTGMSNGERYLPLVMGWGKSRNGRTLREACDKYMQRGSAMQQGGVGE